MRKKRKKIIRRLKKAKKKRTKGKTKKTQEKKTKNNRKKGKTPSRPHSSAGWNIAQRAIDNASHSGVNI